nr:MAG TPA_asm: hypothetical protein [Caudoviricetes sp.]
MIVLETSGSFLAKRSTKVVPRLHKHSSFLGRMLFLFV